MSAQLIPGYGLRSGSGLDRAKLVKFMHRTYRELYPDGELGHLAQTVEQYFSNQTPVWWVECQKNTLEEAEILPVLPSQHLNPQSQVQNLQSVVGCLWLGNAIDQTTGERYAHIFLLYVAPEHRRLGVGAALVIHAENWARERGDRQIGLQVFLSNQPAVNLYQKLGYQSHSLSMLKSLWKIKGTVCSKEEESWYRKKLKTSWLYGDLSLDYELYGGVKSSLWTTWGLQSSLGILLLVLS